MPHLTLSFDDSPRVVSMTGGPGPHLSFSGRGQIIKRQSKVGQIIKFSDLKWACAEEGEGGEGHGINARTNAHVYLNDPLSTGAEVNLLFNS